MKFHLLTYNIATIPLFQIIGTCRGSVLLKEGKPVSESDVVNFKITDSFGNDLVPINSGYYRSSPYYFYNCNTIPCTEETDIMDSGFYANFKLISAGDYEIEVKAATRYNFTV